ncbi:MAG TPA: protein kinase, partial [Polyangiales bacterium]|nr:protein kinase [Polyangiales bacterium]
MAGRTFGDYEIIEPLGRGSVGETFLAKALRGKLDQSVVCLKVLSSHYQSADRAMRRAAIETLQHEAEVVAELHHPNIAALLDVGVHNDSSYLVFELVHGCNLLDVMALRFVLSAKHVAHIGLQVASALACAHGRDVVHRDVKPTNVLLSEAGEVKLVDFGLAKVRAAEASHFTQHVGTPRYWAPEQIRGEPLSPATDVFALGMVLYEALVGVHPFYDDDPAVFRRNVIEATPVRPISETEECCELAAVLDLCLRADPAERFANGTALRNALATTVGTAEVALGQLASTARYLSGDEPEEIDSVLDSDSQTSTPVGAAAARGPRADDDLRGRLGRTTAAFDTRALVAKAAESVPDGGERDRMMRDLSQLARHARSHQSGLGLRTDRRATVHETQEPHRDSQGSSDPTDGAVRTTTAAVGSFADPSAPSSIPATPPERRRKTVRGFSQLGDRAPEQASTATAATPTIQVGEGAAPGANSRTPTRVVKKQARARSWILVTAVITATTALLLAWGSAYSKHAPAASPWSRSRAPIVARTPPIAWQEPVWPRPTAATTSTPVVAATALQGQALPPVVVPDH